MVIRELIKHRHWEEVRNPQFYGNTLAKVLNGIGGVMFCGYLLLFGILLPFAYEDYFPAFEPYHISGKYVIIILSIDLLIRFMYQKAPAANIKPYILLPIKRSRLINFLIFTKVFSLYNLIWLFYIVPFSFITILPYWGWNGVVACVVSFMSLIIINNLSYLIFRTLINSHFLYWLLPIVIYGGTIVSLFVFDEYVGPVFIMLGEYMASHGWLATLCMIPFIAGIWCILYRIVNTTLYNELSMSEKPEKEKATDYSFLDRWGNLGMYMKLELKMVIRNKVCRSQFITGCVLILMFVAILFFDIDAYSSAFGHAFVVEYNFSILGIMMLGNAMSFEGNYIDCLLIRKVSILTLLKAKYCLHCLFALVPFILMMPLVVKERVGFWECVSLYMFTCGFVFPLILQLVVYNKKTTPLNESVNIKGGNTSAVSTIITMVALFVPTLLLSLLNSFLGQMWTNLIVAVIGIAGIWTSRIWLNNLYNRFSKRKYVNLDGFRATR